MSHNIRERKGRTDKPDKLSDSKTYTFLLCTEIGHFFVRTYFFRPRNVARGLLDEVMFGSNVCSVHIYINKKNDDNNKYSVVHIHLFVIPV